MNFVTLPATASTSVWDRVAEHSDIEKTVLLGIFDHIIDYYPNNFTWEDLYASNVSRLETLKRLDSSFSLHIPLNSIRQTTQAILTLMYSKESSNFLKFVKSLRLRVLNAHTVSYYPKFMMTDTKMVLLEPNLTFNVKCMPMKNINHIVCDYKRKVVVAEIEGDYK